MKFPSIFDYSGLVLANAEPDHLPHGVKDLAVYPAFSISTQWILIALGIWLFGSLLLVAYFKIFRKKSKKIVVHPLKKLVIKIEHFAIPENFQDKKVQRDFYHHLSLVFREFLEVKTGLHFTDSTVSEMKKSLIKQSKLSEDINRKIIELMEKSDLVKYADLEAQKADAIDFKQAIVEISQSLIPNQEVLDAELKAQERAV